MTRVTAMKLINCVIPKTSATTTLREESLPQRNGMVERQLSVGNSDDRNADRTSLVSTSSSGGLGSPMSMTSNGSSSAPELNSAQANCPMSFLIVYHRKMVQLFFSSTIPHFLFNIPKNSFLAYLDASKYFCDYCYYSLNTE